jgi:hypothetical protein
MTPPRSPTLGSTLWVATTRARHQGPGRYGVPDGTPPTGPLPQSAGRTSIALVTTRPSQEMSDGGQAALGGGAIRLVIRHRGAVRPSTPRCGLPNVSSTPGSPPRRAAPGTASTRWPRTSGSRSRSSSCTGPAPRSPPASRPSTPWSATSTGGTTRAASKPDSAASHPPSTKISTLASGTTPTGNPHSGKAGESHQSSSRVVGPGGAPGRSLVERARPARTGHNPIGVIP